MLKSYITLAIRNFRKNRVFSLVNVLGMGLSLAAFLFILEYISFETSVDRFHKRLPDISRVIFEGENQEYSDYVPGGMALLLKDRLAEMEGYCRILPAETAKGIVSFQGGAGGKDLYSFREEGSVYADAGLFRLFSLPLTGGVAELEKPNTVAISRSQAIKYYQQEQVTGNVILLNNQFGQTPYTIVAVFEDLPANSTLQFDMVFSLQTLANPANLNGNDWADVNGMQSSFMSCFVLLDPRADRLATEGKIQALQKELFPESKDVVHLQAMAHLHLADGLGDPYPTQGNLGFLYALGSIGGLILLIAWLNYINLSTAGALKRAKEMGIRKVVGSSRSQIFFQFLTESVLLNFAGLVLALILALLLQPAFSLLIGRGLTLGSLFASPVWIPAFALMILGLLASGSYVAYALSNFRASDTLKGSFLRSVKGGLLRKGLVVFQFTVSVALIIATLIVYRQLQFMQQKNLGMNISQLVVVRGPQVGSGEERSKGSIAFLNELASMPYVADYCTSGSVPGGGFNFSFSGFTRPNPQPGDEEKMFNASIFDDRYLNTYQIALAAGSNFTPAMCEKGFEGNQLMLNERAVRELGFASPEEAVGQQVNWGKSYEIVGVVKDYHHMSLQTLIGPQVIIPQYNRSYYTLRIQTGDLRSSLDGIEKSYRQYFPGNPFEYTFSDQQFALQYENEQRSGRLAWIAALLAIVISCLGLFGLTTFSIEQRTKEIGVRKVLGANISQIVLLLTRDFLALVLIAFVIAAPLAGWVTQRWLQDFAYRLPVAPWVFVVAGAVALLIAAATIGAQAFSAAVSNPVKSLRTE